MKTAFAVILTVLLLSVTAMGQPPQGEGHQPPPNRPEVTPSPVIQPDGKVTFNLRAPNAEAVSLVGDFALAGDPATGSDSTPLARNEKGVWTVTVGPLKPEFYHYAFMVDGVRSLDPQNIHISRNAMANNIANWLIVPGPGSDNYLINDVPHGSVREVWYPSPTLKMQRRMFVYTPPGYEAGKERYPVFYLYHGGGGEDELAWINLGRAPQVLDNLIAQGRTAPMIVAMITWQDKQSLSFVDATVMKTQFTRDDFSGADSRFPESLISDVIPFMDKTFRTVADRDHRAVAGTSGGGALALITGLRHLESISWIGVFSGGLPLLPGVVIDIPKPADAVTRRGPDLGKSIDPVKFAQFFPMLDAGLNRQLHLFYWSAAGSEGLLECLHDARKVMDEKGVAYTWKERPEYGHEWSFWRLDLQDFSALLFK